METDNEYLMRSNDLLVQYNNMCQEKDAKIAALEKKLASLPKLRIASKHHWSQLETIRKDHSDLNSGSFYAVFNGVEKTKKIYRSWDEAKVHILRIKKVRHKRFNTNADAKDWLRRFN